MTFRATNTQTQIHKKISMFQSQKTHPKFIRVSFILSFIVAFTSSAKAFTAQKMELAADSVYTFADKMPEFPGGEKGLVTFLNQHIVYPAEALKKNEHGKVHIQFVVSKTGKVENPKVIKGVSTDLDNEALRVISLLPEWTPGEQNGQKVAVQRIIPINFQAPANEPAGWQPTEKSLFLIDDVKMPIGFNPVILNPEKLASAKLLSPVPEEEKAKLISKYGKDAAEGVVLITTKKSEIEFAIADTASLRKNPNCKETITFPQFPGGETKLLSYIADSIQYPFAAKQLKTQGKVFVRITVDKTGKVTNPILARRSDYFLEKEALRVVSTLPDWTPGTLCGEKTDTYVLVPVAFKLDEPKQKKEWVKNDKTIILQDGIRLPSSFDLSWLSYTNLTMYKTLEPTTKEVIKQLKKEYGKDAENGVILIGTRIEEEKK